MASEQGRAAINGTYIGSISEAVQVSDWGQNTTGCTLTHTNRPHQPCLLCGAAPHYCEGCSSRGESLPMWDKCGSDPKWQHIRSGLSCWLKLGPTQTHTEHPHQPPLLQYYFPLG